MNTIIFKVDFYETFSNFVDYNWFRSRRNARKKKKMEEAGRKKMEIKNKKKP